MNDIERFKHRRANRLARRGLRLDADWEEEKHPRAENGQFASGSGSGSGRKEEAPKSEPKKEKPKSSIAKTGKTIREPKAAPKKDKPKSSITKTGKTIGGAQMPKTKGNAPWSPTVNDADEGATSDGFTKEFDKTVKSLKPSDIVYQKGTDGKRSRPCPGLRRWLIIRFSSKTGPQRALSARGFTTMPGSPRRRSRRT